MDSNYEQGRNGLREIVISRYRSVDRNDGLS